MSDPGIIRNTIQRASPRSIAALLLICAAATAGDGSLEDMSPAPPTLRADTAVYNLEQGVLQYAFTFVNPSDSVLYLDCQVPPHATLSGNTLVLDFDRKALPAPASASDSSAGAPAPSAGPLAGGPATGGTMDPKDFPPQRIGAQQTFQGQRRLDRVLGDYQTRPKFSSLQLRMAFYPESASGEGAPYVIERQRRVVAKTINVARRGKAPPPPRVLKFKAH